MLLSKCCLRVLHMRNRAVTQHASAAVSSQAIWLTLPLTQHKWCISCCTTQIWGGIEAALSCEREGGNGCQLSRHTFQGQNRGIWGGRIQENVYSCDDGTEGVKFVGGDGRRCVVVPRKNSTNAHTQPQQSPHTSPRPPDCHQKPPYLHQNPFLMVASSCPSVPSALECLCHSTTFHEYHLHTLILQQPQYSSQPPHCIQEFVWV